MYAEPLSLLFAQYIVRSEAGSALPNAPVRDDRSRIGLMVERTRLRLAASLREAATQVDPYVAPRVSRTA
ncbi:MAG: hypothetical protein JXA67_14180 [Micromonosporaceae bacterium]|nr:hypothetical protein [Micromonosporaceae bacterium]